MKKVFSIILMAFAILAMCGCNENDIILADPTIDSTIDTTADTMPSQTESVPIETFSTQTLPVETDTPSTIPTETTVTETSPSIPDSAATDSATNEPTVPESTVHTHSYTATVTNPTCTAEGYTTHTCDCGNRYRDNETPATGHSYTSKVTKEATCTEKGEKTYTCKCGSSYEEEITMLSHSYTSVVTPPTYTSQGYTTHSCSCGAQYIDTYTDVLVPRYPVLEHEYYDIYTQVCDDGSAWVGFAVPGNMDTMDTSSRVWNLMEDCVDIFCEWTGYSREYVMENRGDKFLVYMVSVAGYMETPDGLCEVIFRYIRGVNMPVDTAPPL